MSSKGKYIGLNQRVPFEVLDSALLYYLKNGLVDRNLIFQQMQEFTSGVNRANKATAYVVQILTRQRHLLDQFRKVNTNTTYDSLKADERKAFGLCLVCLTYPIMYDLLISLSQGFKVQTQISKKFISEKVKSAYGSNRTVDVAIDALLPMIIEFKNIKRDKVSIYSKEKKLILTNWFITELVIYTDIRLAGTKSILLDDIVFRPWFSYFDIKDLSKTVFNYLVTKKDSAVGRGYIAIKTN